MLLTKNCGWNMLYIHLPFFLTGRSDRNTGEKTQLATRKGYLEFKVSYMYFMHSFEVDIDNYPAS
jgi:hypothetical protein